MKILPIIFKKSHITLSQKQNEDFGVKTNSNHSQISVDNPRISFQAAISEKFVSQLQHLHGVHCPTCGVKMLAADELGSILNEIHNVSTAKQMMEFIDKYKEYINPKFENLLIKMRNMIGENTDQASDSVLAKLHDLSVKNSDNQIAQVSQTMKEMSKNREYSEDARRALVHGSKKLNSISKDVARMNYQKYVPVIIRNAVRGLDDSSQVFYSLNDNIRQALTEEGLLSIKPNWNVTLTQFFLNKLITRAKQVLKKVFVNQDASSENIMLSCSHCITTGENIFNNRYKYYNYIYDIAERVLEGGLSENKNYPIELIDSVAHSSRRNLSPDKSHPVLIKLYDELNLHPYSKVVLPLVYEKDMHCAYCGQGVLTHHDKLGIYSQIVDAQSVNELRQIVLDKKEFIKPKFSMIANYFSALPENSSVNEEAVIARLRKKVWDTIQDTIYKSIDGLHKISSKHKFVDEDFVAINSIVKDLDKIMLTKFSLNDKFPLVEYRNQLKANTDRFCNWRYKLRDEIWQVAYNKFQDLYLVQETLAPAPKVIEKATSPLKAILKLMFQKSVATVEHLDPRSKYFFQKEDPEQYKKYMADRQTNLVVACADCNKKKLGIDLKVWASRNPVILKNFAKYLKHIKELQKTRDIKYNVYEVASHFEKLSGKELPPIV